MESAVNELIPSLVKDGVFGEFKFVDLKSDDKAEMGAQFASSLAFLNLVVEGSIGEKVFPLVVKLPPKDPEERENRLTDVMFYNEVTMYKDILPGLGFGGNQLPKMYYGVGSAGLNPEDDIIILENLQYMGFVPSKPKIFLDFDHIALAIKKIAEFHSLSYKMKNENKEKFDQLVKMLKPLKYKESAEQEFDIIRITGMKRGVEAALKKYPSNDLLKKFLKLCECVSKLINLMNHPEEPFSVLCHGDFCNNNVLFKYSETNEPIECAIFDFQLSLYSSPAIDLMFFLYMNTTSDFREKYWYEILKLYWDTLRRNVSTNIPSFNEFLEHIEKRAMYGYLINSWFLPFMLSADELKNESEENFKDLSVEVKTEIFRNVGGEKAEEVICEIVLHLLKMNYLQKFFDFCDEKKFNVN